MQNDLSRGRIYISLRRVNTDGGDAGLTFTAGIILLAITGFEPPQIVPMDLPIMLLDPC